MQMVLTSALLHTYWLYQIWPSCTGSFSNNVGKERQSHFAMGRRKLVGCSYFVKGHVTSSFPSNEVWLFCPTEMQAGRGWAELITQRAAKICGLSKFISRVLSSFHTTAVNTAQFGERWSAGQKAWKGAIAIKNTLGNNIIFSTKLCANIKSEAAADQHYLNC